MQAVAIRRATPEDFEFVQELNHQLFLHDSPRDPYLNLNWPYEGYGANYFHKLVNGEYGVCFVAEVAGEPVGYLAGAVKKDEAWRHVRATELENMFVRPEFRGHGVGRQLAEAFLTWSKKQGAKRAQVIAYYENHPAIGFYKKVGFIPESLSLEAHLED
jgi:ribosomal protein S18 acetylase RimI-like enzyme